MPAGSKPLNIVESVQSSWLKVRNLVQSEVYIRAYLSACNEVHLKACFQV